MTLRLLRLHNVMPGNGFHQRNKANYARIAARHCRVQEIDYTFPAAGDLHAPGLAAAIQEAGGVWLFNDLDYAALLATYTRGESDVLTALAAVPYLCYLCEVFAGPTLQTIGNPTANPQFARAYFRQARAVLACNTRNVEYLRAAGVTRSVRFYPPYGLSAINGIVPIQPARVQPIDVLLYGHQRREFPHRTMLTNAAVAFCAANGLTYNVCNHLFADKDDALRQAKIVVHAPSHDVDTFPWAKAAELMAKKVFFLVEDNQELQAQGLGAVVATYRRNDPAHLQSQIGRYLADPEARAVRVERCYQFLRRRYDMDRYFPEILREVLP